MQHQSLKRKSSVSSAVYYQDPDEIDLIMEREEEISQKNEIVRLKRVIAKTQD